MNFVDPNTQLGYLQQCLSSDKKPVGIFLGAGCPMAIRVGGVENLPLIPDIAGMTERVRAELGKVPECVPLLKLVDGHFANDGRKPPSVEDMLSHVRALRAVAGKEKVRELSAEDLDKLDEKICRVVYELTDKQLPDSNTPYHRLAAWVGAFGRDKPAEIFTTNYDLLMEQAFEDCQVPYFDGFAGARRPFFDIRSMEEDVLPLRWSRLWKLHGSINWYKSDGRGVLRGTTNENGLKRVIHPSHLKYEESRRMPYLAMIDRLRAFLKQPTAVLVLCGYSFRDEHLNEVIMQGLQSTQTAMSFALLFEGLEEYQAAIRLASERPNLSLFARDGAFVSGRRAKWSEKDAEATLGDVGIKWTPAKPDDQKGKQVAEFALGDFAEFGKFLQNLTGRARSSFEVASAE